MCLNINEGTQKRNDDERRDDGRRERGMEEGRFISTHLKSPAQLQLRELPHPAFFLLSPSVMRETNRPADRLGEALTTWIEERENEVQKHLQDLFRIFSVSVNLSGSVNLTRPLK